MVGIIDTKDIQLTIQGQTISSNFGTIDSCQYNLEQLISSACNNQNLSDSFSHLSDDNRKTMDMLSEYSFKAYNDFKNHPMFLSYLEKMSTIKYYAKTNIGSRPSKRKSSSDVFEIETLRAIPFVGGWSQQAKRFRFFGLGSSINFSMKTTNLIKLKNFIKKYLFQNIIIQLNDESSKIFFDLTHYLKDDKDFSEIGIFFILNIILQNK